MLLLTLIFVPVLNMGANVSQELAASIQASLNLANQSSQNCAQRATQANSIDITCGSGCRNTTITVSNIDFSNYAAYQQRCAQQVNLSNDVSQQIEQSFQQAATAIAQQFQLSAANVDQVAKIAAQANVNINNDVVQNCYQRVIQNNGLDISCGSPDSGGNCSVVVNGIRFANAYEPVNNCLLENTNLNQVSQQVSQFIQQNGTSKVESILGPLIAIFVIIILIAGAAYFGGIKLLTDWRFWLVIVLLIVIYFAVAYWRRWFPFETKTS